MLEQFRQVALFADLPDDDLARICADVTDVRLQPGDVLVREGEPGDCAFVITSGQVEILKDTDRRQVLLAVRGEGEVIGEMALLQEEPRSATVRARTEARLASIPRAALDDLLETSPSAARTVFHALVRRMRETNDQLRHQERMVQLGTLTAGVAHELNNPAAAVQRAADQLGGELDRLTGWLARDDDRGRALGILPDSPPAARSPVEASDEEAEVEDWLVGHGVQGAWTAAPALVDAGVGVEALDRLEDGFLDDLDDAVTVLAAVATLRHSAMEIAAGARRLSEIVGALRSYAYLDRAPLQEVDVVGGIEDTLVLLGHVTKAVRLVREYDPDLPRITALGGELNQVWTNLVRNACDALAAVDAPVLTLRASRDGESVIVEVEDNGPGIPADTQHRVFDAFYTTKAPGSGTGLGLQITARIVLEHRGDLTLRSEPGRTTFRVTLPVSGPSPA